MLRLLLPWCRELHSGGGTWWAALPRLVLAWGGRSLPIGEQTCYFGVFDGVAITLLGEKELAIGREILVAGVAGDDRVEMGRPAIGFGTEEAPQALCLLLTRAEGAGDLDSDVGV